MFISSLEDGEVSPCLCCLTVFLKADAWIPVQGKCLAWEPVMFQGDVWYDWRAVAAIPSQ